jgi:hypothetical protein
MPQRKLFVKSVYWMSSEMHKREGLNRHLNDKSDCLNTRQKKCQRNTSKCSWEMEIMNLDYRYDGN